jgi:hypothetical protein
MHTRATRQFVLAVLLAMTACGGLPRKASAARDWEPLILKGYRFPGLIGADLSSLEVAAVHHGKLEPIPFQVDEVSDKGAYVLPDGPEGSTERRTRLGAKDEIVIMFSDLGERADGGIAGKAFELEVSERDGGPHRYAYLATVATPRLSPRRYVSYDPSRNLIETESYRVGMPNGLPVEFALRNRGDEVSSNLTDRLKVRLNARVLHLMRFSFNEDDIRTAVRAWKCGPVRVIRRLDHSVDLILGLGSPVFERHDFFYRDMIRNPFVMDLPFAPRLFFGDIRVRIDLDFNDLRGYQVLWSGMASAPVRISDPPLRIGSSGAQVSWIAIRGGAHTTLQTLAPTPDLAILNRRLYFNDDPDRPDPPEHLGGEHPGLGYVITGWENLESGVHLFDSLLITAAADYSPDVFLEELRDPPQATVRPASEQK